MELLFNWMLDPEECEKRTSSLRESWPTVCVLTKLIEMHLRLRDPNFTAGEQDFQGPPHEGVYPFDVESSSWKVEGCPQCRQPYGRR